MDWDAEGVGRNKVRFAPLGLQVALLIVVNLYSSGDGTLSVIDVRSKKPGPLAQSEDQEDELLSIAPIRNGEKTVVGTQQGILSIFNRSSGWGDCVDRVPGYVLHLPLILL